VNISPLIPAKAGIYIYQAPNNFEIPAFAGMSGGDISNRNAQILFLPPPAGKIITTP